MTLMQIKRKEMDLQVRVIPSKEWGMARAWTRG